jgi:hypothetical protein
VTSGVINIFTAELVGDYRIHLAFDDGTQQVVDFKPFLSHSIHPDIRAYLDVSRFGAFRLEHGELVWGDYDLCFPIIDLYRNQLERSAELDAVAWQALFPKPTGASLDRPAHSQEPHADRYAARRCDCC